MILQMMNMLLLSFPYYKSEVINDIDNETKTLNNPTNCENYTNRNQKKTKTLSKLTIMTQKFRCDVIFHLCWQPWRYSIAGMIPSAVATRQASGNVMLQMAEQLLMMPSLSCYYAIGNFPFLHTCWGLNVQEKEAARKKKRKT